MKTEFNDNRGPVFIVGMNGSGTTMIQDHIGRHPEIFGFRQETYVLPWYLSIEQKYGDLALDANFHKLWRDMRGAYPFRVANKGMAVDLPKDWRAAPRHAGGVFDRIMREFAAREGKARWCEKTPIYVLHMTKIAAVLPEARFIHIIRDGRDCAVSCHRRWRRHPTGTILRWRQVVDEGRRQGALLSTHYMEMRYEEVTSDPELYLRSACEFLGVAYDECVLTIKRPRKFTTGRDSKTIVSTPNRNKRYFPDSRLLLLERIAGKQLANLGYSTRFPQSDVVPSVFARAWSVIHDVWHTFLRHLRNKLTIDKHMSWLLFFSRLQVILRSKLK